MAILHGLCCDPTQILNAEAPSFFPNQNTQLSISSSSIITTHHNFLPSNSAITFSSPNTLPFFNHHQQQSPYLYHFTYSLAPSPLVYSHSSHHLLHTTNPYNPFNHHPILPPPPPPPPQQQQQQPIPSSSPILDQISTTEVDPPKMEAAADNDHQKGRGNASCFRGRNGTNYNDRFRTRQRFFRGYNNKQEWRVKCSVTIADHAPKPLQSRRIRYHAVVPVEKDGHITTVMIRNIPNKYTREMLMKFLDDHCMVENQKAKAIHSSDAAAGKEAFVSAFDFLYLPMDFQTRLNKGYAFVNFTNPRAVWKFHLACNNEAWGHCQSKKRIQIASARLQGKEELVKHFEKMAFPREEFLPLCFSPARDGSRESVDQSTVGICTSHYYQ